MALSVIDDARWRTLSELIDRADWADWPLSERHARRDEIDAAISQWTARGADLVEDLSASGVLVGKRRATSSPNSNN